MVRVSVVNKKTSPNFEEVFVPGEGIEPSRPKALDFESSASTSSATQAFFL